jgi:hypothetical protein
MPSICRDNSHRYIEIQSSYRHLVATLVEIALLTAGRRFSKTLEGTGVVGDANLTVNVDTDTTSKIIRRYVFASPDMKSSSLDGLVWAPRI